MDGDQWTGRQIARYQVEGKLGQGGMGSVYRAWDTQLHRWVAVKILSASSGQAADTRARFLKEARAVAALNHPNIVTIYEIGQHEAVDYIAMECVAGHTLRAHLQSRKLLDVEEALNYGVQIADAVSSAHSAGITHRDLKPANIMVSDRGRVKVLDFGIAKHIDYSEESEKTITVELETMPGILLGTPNYMSPEQVQGKPVDWRSDIFALGAILYEMLSGRRAFDGSSAAAVMAGILTLDPPPISSFRPVPEELDRLVSHCLRKDVERRLQHADDLKILIQELISPTTSTTSTSLAMDTQPVAATDPASGASWRSGPLATWRDWTATPSTATGASPASSRKKWQIGGVLLLVVAAAVAGWQLWDRPSPKLLGERATLERVTADDGLAVWPTLSRDGKFIAYASDRPDGKNLHIWVQQLGGGQPIQLTNGPAEDTEPSFSPDGTQIAFRSERDGGGIYVVPALGGEPRLLARQGRGPRYSPDGKKIVYWVGGGDLGKMYIIDPQAGSAPQPFHHDFLFARSPIWSPDGKFIMFEAERMVDNERRSLLLEWWIAPASGGEPIPTGNFWRLRNQKIYASAPTEWLPGNRVLFAGSLESIESLWSMEVEPTTGKMVGVPERLTFGTSIDSYPAAIGETQMSRRVAFSSISKNIQLWVLPFDANRGTPTGELSPLTQGAGSQSTQLTTSADGQRIAFLSDRNGEARPWIRDMATGREVSVAGTGAMWAPSISPDGRTLAWSVFDEGSPQQTFRAPIGPEGQLGLAELLCDGCGPIIDWSPDGRSITYGKSYPARTYLLDLDTGESYNLLEMGDTDLWGGRFSPDGKWLTMHITPSPTQSSIYVARFDPERREAIPFSEWIPITTGATWDDKARWAPDSKSIYFISERDGFRCIWRQQLDPETGGPDGAPTAIRHFHQARRSLRNVDMGPLAFQVAPDALIFSLGELSGNVWVLSPDSR